MVSRYSRTVYVFTRDNTRGSFIMGHYLNNLVVNSTYGVEAQSSGPHDLLTLIL
jgi:hypothetical protein